MSRKPESCPFCGAATALSILYGMPSAEARDDEEKGKIVLGGCCVEDDSPDWACTQCKKRWVVREGKVIEST